MNKTLLCLCLIHSANYTSQEIYNKYANCLISAMDISTNERHLLLWVIFLPSTTWIQNYYWNYNFFVPLSSTGSTERDESYLSELAVNGLFQLDSCYNVNDRLREYVKFKSAIYQDLLKFHVSSGVPQRNH